MVLHLYEQIRLARRQQGMTQSQLAREVHCSQSAISMYESGHLDALAGKTVKTIADRFGLEVPSVVDSGTLTAAPTRRVINVYRDGAITLDRENVTLAHLTDNLAAAHSQYNDLGVLIRGDATVQFQRVAEVLNACKQAGIAELGISVRLASKGSARR